MPLGVPPMYVGYTTELVDRSLSRLRGGDEQAIAEVLEASERRLGQLAERMLRDFQRVKRWQAPDDLFQDVAIRLLAVLRNDTPDNARHFFRLAARIMRRRLIDLARQYQGPENQAAHHATQGSLFEPCQIGTATHDPQVLAQWTQMHEAAENLPDELREVFDLMFYHGQRIVDVQRATGLDPKTIRRRWVQARLAVRKTVETVD